MDTPTTEELIAQLDKVARSPFQPHIPRLTMKRIADRLRQLDAEVHERPGKEVLEALRRDLEAYHYNPDAAGMLPSCPSELWQWVLGGESHEAVSDEGRKATYVAQWAEWAEWAAGLEENDLADRLALIHIYAPMVREALRAESARRAAAPQVFVSDDKTAWEYMHWLETHRPEDLRNWALLHDRAEVFPEAHTAGSDLWPDGSVSEHTHPETPMAFTGSEPRLHFKGLGGLWRDLSDKVVSTTVTLQSADDGALWNLTTQFADECAKPLVEEPEAAEPVIEYPQVLVVNGMIVVELHENRSDYIGAVTVMALHQNPHPDGVMVTVEKESSEDAPHLRQFVVPGRLADKFVEDLKLAIVWGAA